MSSRVNEGFEYEENPADGPVTRLPMQVVEQNGKAKSEPKDDTKTPAQVGAVEIFRFADGFDILLMIVGTIAALAFGLCLPCMIIVLGDMSNSFYKDGRNRAAASDAALATVTPQTVALLNQTTTSVEDSMRTFAYYYIGIGFGVLLTGYIMIAAWVWASARQTHRIRLAYFRAVIRQDVAWMDVNTPGELAIRLSDDLNKIQSGIGDKVALLFMGLSSFLTGFVIGFVYGWELTLVIVAFTPVLAFCAMMLVKFSTSFTQKESKAYAKAGSIAEEALSSVRTVAALGAEARVVEKYTASLEEAKQTGIKKGLTVGIGMGTTWLVIYCSYCLAFWYGSKLVRGSLSSGDQRYDGGTILTVFFSVLVGAFSLGNAAPSLQEFATARGAAAFVYAVIDRVPPVDTQSDRGKKPKTMTGRVQFQNVAFAYPARKNVKILRNLSFKIDEGETVAFVGPSGCGKSTTIQLLQRFYDTDAGDIFVDGLKVKDWNISHLRDFIGVVSQEPVLFSTTIGENIRYGRIGVTQEEIELAAKKANAHTFIMEQPKKYDTMVGERGSQLSGGQKQRIAIARAIVRDPKILLLDEATSALDATSEKVVQSALDEARQGRTTIIIAHRLSTIRGADKIIAMEQGEVVEQGTHAELMQARGLYHRLVTNQTKEDSEKTDNLEDAQPDVLPEAERPNSPKSGRNGRSSVLTLTESSDDGEVKAEENAPVSMMRIFRLNSPEYPYIIIGWLAAMATGGSQPVFAILFSALIGVLAEAKDMVKQERETLIYSCAFIAIGVGTFFSWLLQHWMFAISGENLTVRIRKMTLQSMLRQEIGWFDRQENSTGALTTRLATDASAVQGAAGIRIATLLQAATLLIAALIIAFVYSWKLTLVILAFIPLVVIGGAFQNKVLVGQAGKNQKQLEGAGKVAFETISNFRTVSMLGLQQKFFEAYEERLQIPLRNEVTKAHTYGIAYSFSQAVIYFAYAAAFTFGAYLITTGEMDFAGVFRVFGALVFCAMGLGNASSWAPDAAKAKIAAARIFGLIDRTPEIDSSSTGGKQLERLVGNIEFKDVRFAFPTRSHTPILKGLSVSVGAGQTLALVGHSGCGKSTTISLVERFYQAMSGSVTLDGHQLEDLNIKWLRSKLGFVQQEPLLFSGTVKENILYGCDEDVGMDRVVAAARDANIHDFIMNLPSQYDTDLGDRGSQLSGGQKQRIAIARAVVRNPKILLLDEATSALDTESEIIVQEALDRAQRGRTCIVIAHRLNTIQNADQICVISHGRVAEQGTHGQLMGLRGLYWKSFTTLAGGS
ncbi:Multidrug resistance protein 1A [Hypsibius exemplaris]|uniref:ABC-type xenobiotic transporter n=1 Tax=Hypsibius exemplaris TaxID=2072580 RepID=A0A1W0WA47_HYPEX|nr:Multidrug resistance protein 1A [Hypsibius exemplaris]